MKKILLSLAIIISLYSCRDAGTTVNSKKIIDAIENFNDQDYFSGVAVITKKDNQIFALVNGNKNDKGEKIDLDTQFFIGSVTKQFTAAAVLRALYDKNLAKLHNQQAAIDATITDLEKPLSTYLDRNNYVWKKHYPNWANIVNLHQLLSNTSGIINYTEVKAFTKEDKNSKSKFYQQEHKPSDIIALVAKNDLLFEPGTEYNYSNTNFFLLGIVLEAITGVDYQTYLHETFFKPLGMTSSYSPQEGNVIKLKENPEWQNLALQFLYNPFETKPGYLSARNRINTNFTSVQATSSIISTVNDLIKWNAALHRDFLVIPPPLYELMVKNHSKNLHNNFYGYGIIPTETNYGMIYTHTGGIDGYQSILRYYKDNDISLVILSNTGPDEELYNDKIAIYDNMLKSKVANAVTRRIIAETRIRVQYPDNRNFINLLQDIDEASLIEQISFE